MFGLGDVIALLACAALAVCIVRPRLGELVSVRVTLWSGSLGFLLVHTAFWWAWTRFIEPRPYELLTMVLSLEAIVLSTLTMIGVNLLSKRQPPVRSGRAELIRLARIERDTKELLRLVRTADIAIEDLDRRIADLQEARHDDCQ